MPPYMVTSSRRASLPPLILHTPGSAQVIGVHQNALLLGEMLAAAGSPDKLLIHHICNGFPMAGPLRPSGNWAPVAREPELSLAELRESRSLVNAEMLGRVRKAAPRDDEVLRLFEEKCDEEVASGFARWISAGSACP